MKENRQKGDSWRMTLMAAAVAACFASGGAFANPTGPAVANGQVSFHQQGNLLQITNSPNAIINWQSFSIDANEITRFLQQSASSAVLNRVITQNPSSIFGILQSNGRVFLINPNGIVFGPGSQVDVAGLLASTLNLSDQDFLAGRLRLTEVPGAGSVLNQGAINAASGGQVYLVGPAVKNEGVISSANGEVILAAGNSVELVEPGTPNLRVEITAPDNEAVNLGQIAADAGRVGIYAGLIDQSGSVQANTAQVTEDGRIVLKATKGVNLEAGSVTAASGVKGGNVTVETESGTITVSGKIDASGSAEGGSINLAVTGDLGSIDLGTGLNAGNAAIQVSGTGNTTTLSGDMVTAGASIDIIDSVVLGAPANITLDTTNGGAVASGANITITGTVDDDVAGSTGLTLSSGTVGVNTVGGAIGGTATIASLTTSGSATNLNGGTVTTTGDQVYNDPVTLGAATTLTTWPGGTITVDGAMSSGANALTVNAGNVIIGADVASGAQVINAVNNITVAASANRAWVQANGPQVVIAGGALTVEGAASGTNYYAAIQSSDTQTVTAGSIALAGGSGTGNRAELLAEGPQQVTAVAGDLRLTGGSGGSNNRAAILGSGQVINVAGDLTLTAGGAGGPPVRISSPGGPGSAIPTNLVVTVGGDVVLTGKDAAPVQIGGTSNGAANDITMTVGGSVILTPGTAGDTRIGGAAANNAGGDISITTLGIGSIALNSAGGIGTAIRSGSGNVTLQTGSITQGADSSIRANHLTASVGSGADLGGANQLSGFNASGGYSDGITLNNTSLLLTVTGIDLFGGPLTLTQDGDLALTGSILSGPQSINTTGNISVLPGSETVMGAWGSQVISADGALLVQGGASGVNESVSIVASGDQAVTASSVTVAGGSGEGNFVQILQSDPGSTQMITVTGGGGLAVSGGIGLNNFARIESSGEQTVTAGTVTLTGGEGMGNTAILFAGGPQNVAAMAGDMTLTGGASGSNNRAAVVGFDQMISVAGNLTLLGAGAAGVPVRMGSPSGPTHMMITVGGDVTLDGTGGSQVGIGSMSASGANDIAMTVGGNVTLSPGATGDTRIGATAANVAGGEISIVAGGDIALNSAGGVGTAIRAPLGIVYLQANAITEGADSSIRAGQLVTRTMEGAMLGGDNQAAAFLALNFVSGDVVFNNASPLLTVNGVGQTPWGALILTQNGDLAVTGGVASGPQWVSASGNMLVAPDMPGGAADIMASGTQTFSASNITVAAGGSPDNFAQILQTDPGSTQTILANGGNLVVQGGSAGVLNFARIESSGAQNITAGTIALNGGDGDGNFAQIRQANSVPTQTITVPGGGSLTVSGGGPGPGNYAAIDSDGAQSVTAGNIAITGGAGGVAGQPPNQARLQALGLQSVQVTSGDMALLAGADGFNNRATVTGSDQWISVAGNLMLTSRDSLGAARLGRTSASPGPTNLMLNVGGDVVVTGGTYAPAAISGASLTEANNIHMLVGGNVTLNPGAGAEARIGGPPNSSSGGSIQIWSGGNIALNSAKGVGSAIRTTGDLDLIAFSGSITEGPDSSIAAARLGFTTDSGASLVGNNQVAELLAWNTSSGDIVINNISPLLTVTGVSQIPSGALILTQNGDLALTGGIFSGPQSINGTGDILVISVVPGSGTGVEALGSQVIGAEGALLVRGSASGMNESASVVASGDQTITASSIAVTGGGGDGNFAQILQTDPSSTQTVTVNGGGSLVVSGGASGLNNWARIESSGAQNITAGNIALNGGDGDGNFARIPGGQGQDIVATNIAITGGAGGTGNAADLLQTGGGFSQTITVRDGGTLSLQGGGGTNNFARILSDNGNQTILGSPVITVTGGTGSNSSAMIRTRSGVQTITAGDTTLTGGAGGFANFAVIQGAEQYITVHGDLSLTGRDSAQSATGSVGIARMGNPGGGAAVPTNLVLDVDGNVTLTGGNVDGAGAAIGSSSDQNADIVMTAGGNITLNPGTVAGASVRIGSEPAAGGNISLTSAGGSIALNSANGIGTAIRTLDNVTLTANALTQGADSVIQANQLITTTAAGTSLGGNNQVAVFNAVNGAIGGVLFHNASPSLTVAGITTVPGPFTLDQNGDLAIIGDVWSGPQWINASGDMTVGSDSSSVILYAAGPQTVMGSGEPHASWKALGVGLLDRLAGHSPVNISAKSLTVQGGSEFGSFAGITGGPINITTTGDRYTGNFNLSGGSGFGSFGWVLSSQDVNLNIGGNLKLDSGSGFLSFARIQTVHPTSKINIYFPNLSSGGYFVNGVEGAYRDGLSGFYTGPLAAKPGKGLLVDYGM